MEGGGLNLPLNEKHTVLYTGSHDNDTTVGWYRKNYANRLKGLYSNEDIAWHFIEQAYGSDAETVIVPLQDVLSLDTEARMNTPGTTEGNWTWRYREGSLTEDLKNRLRSLVSKYRR